MGLARVLLTVVDGLFLLVIFGSDFHQFCGEGLGMLHKVYMYSERRLFRVAVCLLAGRCEVRVTFESPVVSL